MKTCKNEGCGYPVFSHLYCKSHQYLRTDSKKPKRTPLKIKITQVKDYEADFGFKLQSEMFAALWENARNEKGEVFCRYTGEKLNIWAAQESWYPSLFAHVLPKGQYTYFKLNPENIRIVLPEFHKIVDQGTIEDRKKHPNWRFDIYDTEKELLKLQYKYFKTKNLLK